MFNTKKKLENQAAINEAAIQWATTMSVSEFSSMFNELTQEALSIQTTNEYWENFAYDSLRTNVESVKRIWIQIDKKKLTAEQAKTMYDCINVKLPDVLKTYVAGFYKKGRLQSAYADTPCKTTFRTPKTVLSKIIEQMNDIKDSQKFPLVNLNGKSSLNKTKGVFPKLDTNHPAISEKLLHLEELWSSASSKTNSAEDEYLLEEIASSYLPEAWKTYSTFKLADKEYSDQAEKIIIEQLSLFENRIQTILNASFAASLLALSAQTNFLKLKLEENEPASNKPTGIVAF